MEMDRRWQQKGKGDEDAVSRGRDDPNNIILSIKFD
jgi:hypothetical protein